MNPIGLKLIKISLFAASSWISSEFLLKRLNRRGRTWNRTDPEIAAASILCGAVITAAVSIIIKKIL